MTIIRSIPDLLVVLARLAPSDACKKAIESNYSDSIKVYGEFLDELTKNPYWIVRVRSAMGSQWLLRVAPDPSGSIGMYVCYRIEEVGVPWKEWAGQRGGQNRVLDGDISEEAAQKRQQAKSVSASAVSPSTSLRLTE
jgi:hypothetical protein